MLPLVSFTLGIYLGKHRSENYADGQFDLATQIYGNVRSTYGGVRYGRPETKNIVATIHLFKDMDLAVYQEAGVKTVRVYGP